MAAVTTDLAASRWTYAPDDPGASWAALLAVTGWMPDATLQVAEPFPGHYELRVLLRTPDSRNPTELGKIGHRKPLPDHVWRAGPVAMQHHLRRCLREVAVHEADEWLIIGGFRPYDPHHPRGAVHA